MGRTWFTFLLLAVAIVGHAAAPQPFDVSKGNQGVIQIAKTPENITVDDVRSALNLPRIDAKVKDRNSSEKPSIWTAAGIGLREGTSDEVGLANAAALRAAVRNSNCIGLKLEKLHRFFCPFVPYVSVEFQHSFNE